jgi:uncharacterized protein (TIGR03435 family)
LWGREGKAAIYITPALSAVVLGIHVWKVRVVWHAEEVLSLMRDVSLAIGLAGLLFGTSAAPGQVPAKMEFDAASVKTMAPNSPMFPAPTGGPGTTDPGLVTWSGTSLKWLLKTAYGVKLYQISGPEWLDFGRYAIVARVPEGATKEQVNLMWQNLLKNRLGVAIHHESRVLQGEAMTLTKGAAKLKKTDLPDSASQMPPQAGLETGPDGQRRLPTSGLQVAGDGAKRTILGRAQSLDDVAAWLSQVAGHPVIDETGLTGRYDFSAEFDLSPNGDGTNAPCFSCAISIALQQELGVKLVKRAIQLDVIVVDHAERVPTEN